MKVYGVIQVIPLVREMTFVPPVLPHHTLLGMGQCVSHAPAQTSAHV